MFISANFERPKDQPLRNSTKFRMGWWIEAGKNGSEGFTCGWNYYPLNNREFNCLAHFDGKHDFTEKRKYQTFSDFTNINLYNHYDMTWRLYNTELPINLVGDTDSNRIIDS
jgi:hypothetical protein